MHMGDGIARAISTTGLAYRDDVGDLPTSFSKGGLIHDSGEMQVWGPPSVRSHCAFLRVMWRLRSTQLLSGNFNANNAGENMTLTFLSDRIMGR
jgi:hypothetical protein